MYAHMCVNMRYTCIQTYICRVDISLIQAHTRYCHTQTQTRYFQELGSVAYVESCLLIRGMFSSRWRAHTHTNTHAHSHTLTGRTHTLSQPHTRARRHLHTCTHSPETRQRNSCLHMCAQSEIGRGRSPSSEIGNRKREISLFRKPTSPVLRTLKEISLFRNRKREISLRVLRTGLVGSSVFGRGRSL
jgi:hypothetical protein